MQLEGTIVEDCVSISIFLSAQTQLLEGRAVRAATFASRPTASKRMHFAQRTRTRCPKGKTDLEDNWV